MHVDVDAHVASCHSCQVNKSGNKKPEGKLLPPQIPLGAWDTVSVDFVTALPVTPDGFDAVMVVVDYLTKMVRLVPMHKTDDAEHVARMFVDRIFSMHGVPRKLISDRDSKFTSKFWAEFSKRVNMHPAMSSAFHPQSDGNTERVNRLMQDVLRHYVSPYQDDWDKYLGLVEFAINSAYHESIKSSPFVLSYGRNPKTPVDMMLSLDTTKQYKALPQADKFVTSMQAALERAKFCLQAAQCRQKAYADPKRGDTPVYKKGDLVALKTTNLKFRSGHNKLQPKYVGPFKVVDRINEVAYKLALPDSMSQLHDVFHTSLLKRYTPSDRQTYLPPPPMLVEGELEYEVQAVLQHADSKRGKRLKRFYLVRWKGCGLEHDSWEPAENLRNAPELLKDYLDNHKVHARTAKSRAPKSHAKPVAVPARRRSARSMRMAACLCPCFAQGPAA